MLPQLAPPTAPGTATVSSVDGGLNNPFLAFLRRSVHVARSSAERKYGVMSFSVIVWRANGGSTVGNGCVGQACSPGTSLFGTARSSIGNTGSPVTRSNTNMKPCLVASATASIVLPLRLTVMS